MNNIQCSASSCCAQDYNGMRGGELEIIWLQKYDCYLEKQIRQQNEHQWSTMMTITTIKKRE